MASSSKKKQQQELRRGLAALAVILAGLLALGVILVRRVPVQPPEPTTILPPNPYGETDFRYEGDYLTCLSGPSVLGIDVSSHQQTIDWQQVADAGIEFVMIRVGYRGYETGLINPDTMAQQNYAGAKAAGLRVGAYFFSQAVNEQEAIEEAEFVLEQISPWQVDMPVVFDWEYVDDAARTEEMTGTDIIACIDAFNQKITEAGYSPMVYFNPHMVRNTLDLEQLAEYPFWLAMYSDRMTFEYRVDMWQYTHEGSVPGITGNVDINLWLAEE